MKRDIIIVEDFYSDPDAVVRYAQTLDYVFPYEQPGSPSEGRRPSWRASRYRNVPDCPFKSSDGLIGQLEMITGESIDRESWNLDFPVDERGYPQPDHRAVTRKSAWWNCCFHVKHDQQQQIGGGIHSHTDHDSWNPVGLDGWAGIVYLNKISDSQAGLRLWANKDPGRQFDWMTPGHNWILQDTFANVYNRLILHRGRAPHSGSNGWGASVADGRMFQTFFFRVARHQEMPGVTPEDLRLTL